MLNSQQIEAALTQRGLKPELIMAHAVGYTGPGLPFPLFVKSKGGDTPATPVGAAPLVIHPDLEDGVRQLSETIPGLQPEAGHYFNTNLIGFPKRVNKGATKTAYGVALNVADEQSLDALIRHLMYDEDPGSTAFAEASLVTIDAFKEAFKALEPRITAAQRRMLLGHAQAPGHRLSMEAIAQLGGYDSYGAANSQYGSLGSLVARHFAINGLANKTQMLAYAAEENDAQGHFQWVLRTQVVDALVELGLIKPALEEPALRAAAMEVDDDPQCAEIPETTRQALIYARVGQGAYRRSLLELWDRQCAITTCNLPEVLVASHAKAWAASSNEERLDTYNGLLLAASVDRLFDQGLISFDSTGQLLCRPGLPLDQLKAIGLAPDSRLRSVDERHQPYLAFHRQKHGFDRA